MISPQNALKRLREGNLRFASGEREYEPEREDRRRAEIASAQTPFAIILGCSDSRVPAEIVFDQGLGDLFVIRVAGNIVAPTQIGSVEFAAQSFGTRLVVVLGHSECGAVQATLQELQQPGHDNSKNLSSIVDRIKPAIADLILLQHNPDGLMQAAVRANISASVAKLSKGSEIIDTLVKSGELMIVGAEYCLQTGEVEFFDQQ